MIAACARANVKLMIAYRCQYEPYNREVTRLARSGEFGRPRLIQAFNGQTTGLPEQWRLKKALAGGGALPDIGLYCLNGVRALLGEEPVSVQAQVHSPPGDAKFAEVEETVDLHACASRPASRAMHDELRHPRIAPAPGPHRAGRHRPPERLRLSRPAPRARRIRTGKIEVAGQPGADAEEPVRPGDRPHGRAASSRIAARARPARRACRTTS